MDACYCLTAEYAKLPFIPPYLQPGNHQITDGVNFASGAAGALAQTRPAGSVCTLTHRRLRSDKLFRLNSIGFSLSVTGYRP